MRRLVTVLSLAALALLGSAPPALADRGGDDGASGGGGNRAEVRVAGTCGGAVRSSLKLKARDGGIEVGVEVEHARSGSSWRIVLVQEGRIALRTTARAGSASGAVHVERRVGDLAGADTISFRASTADGVGCRASATLPGA
jgi:hypothetical protein